MNIKLIEPFADFKDFKDINRETMMSVVQDVFKTTLEKKYDAEDIFDVIINVDKGDLEIWWNRAIVANGKVENPNTEMAVREAHKIDSDFEVGEEVSVEVKLNEFDRRTIVLLGQNLNSRIRDLEKDTIFNKYKSLIGTIITGEVYQIWSNELLALDDEGNELILPKSELIPKDFYKKGDMVRAVVAEVDMKKHNPRIILSRTANTFLEKLFEQEIPEIFDGVIVMKEIVRIPGEKAKVTVESYDDRIDPVGACIGIKGSRIHGIVKELRNESIDVINYTENMSLLISRCLAPAKINNIKLDEEKKRAEVYLNADQVSFAIGRKGSNIRLTNRLTGYEIDAYKDEDTSEDVSLDEFSDEIDAWVIDEIKKIGCDTAKSVLQLSKEDLVRRTDLEEETIEQVLTVLRSEFDE